MSEESSQDLGGLNRVDPTLPEGSNIDFNSETSDAAVQLGKLLFHTIVSGVTTPLSCSIVKGPWRSLSLIAM